MPVSAALIAEAGNPIGFQFGQSRPQTKKFSTETESSKDFEALLSDSLHAPMNSGHLASSHRSAVGIESIRADGRLREISYSLREKTG